MLTIELQNAKRVTLLKSYDEAQSIAAKLNRDDDEFIYAVGRAPVDEGESFVIAAYDSNFLFLGVL